MKIFVTGADGFVGINLLHELINRHFQVVAFIEPDHSLDNCNLDYIEIKHGNILDLNILVDSMKGCDTVIHLAARTDLWPYRSKIQKRVNIEGTKNMVKAAKINDIKRFIHIGTANSFGFGPKDNLGDETKPYNAHRYKLDYLDTKYEAQQFLLKEVKESGFPIVILNPTFMFGKHACNYGSATYIQSIYNKSLPGYTKGGRNYISVKDVCVGIINALTFGRVGECYILGNQNLSYNELFTLIAKVTGSKPPW